MSGTILLTDNTLVVDGDKLSDLEEPIVCPGTVLGGWETENKPMSKLYEYIG